MPFCTKCGTQMPDDYRFCMKCGAPVVILDSIEKPAEAPQITEEVVAEPEPVAEPQPAEVNEPETVQPEPSQPEPETEPQVPDDQGKDSRTLALEEMDRMMEYFKPMKTKYVELKKIEEEIQKEKHGHVKTVTIPDSDGSGFMTAGGIMVGFAVFPGIIFFINGINTIRAVISASGFFTIGSIIIWTIVISLWCIVIGLGIFFFLFGKSKLKKYSLKLMRAKEEARQQKNKELEEIKSRELNLNREITEHFRKFGKTSFRVNECNPANLRVIRELISSNRVDNIEDALLLYRKRNAKPSAANRAGTNSTRRPSSAASAAAPITAAPASSRPAYSSSGNSSGSYRPSNSSGSSGSSGKNPFTLRASYKNAEIYTLRYVPHQDVLEQMRYFEVLRHGAQLSASNDGTVYIRAPLWTAMFKRVSENTLSCVYRFEFISYETRNGMPKDPGGMKSVYDSVGRMLVYFDPETTVKKEAINLTSKSYLF